jgi:hypothetical protein
MIPVLYFRSSSYNAWGMCPQQYFLSYVLGIPQKDNKKAEMGTVVHKVMEALAAGKFALQKEQLQFTDDVMGVVDFKPDMLFSDNFVDYLFDKSYKYYTEKSTNTYEEKDRKLMREWTFKPLRLLDGAFDPRKRDIIAPELHFDFEIDEPWAAFEYEMPDGSVAKGNLALKGTIDLVTKVGEGIYESIDWKTGQRLDWASLKPWPHNIKTYEKLMVDPQLRIYHYALHHKFPDLHQIIPTIYFINDHGTKAKPVAGGVYSMAFEKDRIDETKEMIRKRFEKIKATARPELVKSWKCKSFCHYGKTPHPSGEIDPRTGSVYTICEYIARKTRDIGINDVIKKHIHPGYSLGNYKAPGT